MSNYDKDKKSQDQKSQSQDKARHDSKAGVDANKNEKNRSAPESKNPQGGSNRL